MMAFSAMGLLYTLLIMIYDMIYIVPLDTKVCIWHFVKWQIHPFISKGTIYTDEDVASHRAHDVVATLNQR